MLSAQTNAQTVAVQVAKQNQIGGQNLTTANIVSIVFGGPDTNPTVTVKVQRTDLPTFFARVWGKTQVAVAATATAEVYNPSGASLVGGTMPPVAPMCVKPWLLPNISPNPAPANPQIFDPASGAILDTNLLGWTNTNATALKLKCAGGNCSTLPPPTAWHYYPGNPSSFPAPTDFPTCAPALTTPYEQSVAGCVQTPIACGSNPNSTYLVSIDNSNYGLARDTQTADAVNCLTNAAANQGDTVDPAVIKGSTIPPPYEFIAGASNPIPGLAGNNTMVSNSLVTVPVYDVGTPPFVAPPAPPGTVQIVGFIQLFLNPEGTAMTGNGHVNATIINLVGCGETWTTTPIIGNGASPVTVRLISSP